MLEKQRNTLIKKAFESAKIIAPGTELTALEIDDAAYTLNCMLQGWSNEGFRLFNMKTGYMPLLSKKNEYKMSTEAYSDFGAADLVSVENIGATKVKVESVLNMIPGQPVVFLNNVLSEENKIVDIDYVDGVISLEKPINISVYADDNVFYGKLLSAKTEVKQYVSGFSSIVLSEYTKLPVVGDDMFINYSDTWVKVSVSNVNASNNTVYFLPDMGAGRISKPHVLYGSSVSRTTSKETYEVSPRKVNVSKIPFDVVSLSIKTKDLMDEQIGVESTDGLSFVLKKPVSEAVLDLLGKKHVFGNTIYPSDSEIKWSDIPSDIINERIDWGSVTQVPADKTESWGYVSDVVTKALDFKSLTGSAEILGFAKDGNDIYVSVKSDGKSYLLYKDFAGKWSVVMESVEAKLFVHNGTVYVYNVDGGLFSLLSGTMSNIYAGFKVENIVKKDELFYIVSGSQGGVNKAVLSTKDFLTFSDLHSVPEYVDFSNSVEFDGKLYCGKGRTFVTKDMKDFSDINVYSENRAVIGGVLYNFNASTVCSYSSDGVKFYPLPIASTNVSATFSIHGCSFIAVYGKIGNDGIVGTQIFSADSFEEKWTLQTSISGKVFDIYEDEGKVYFVSDTEAKSMTVTVDSKAESTEVYMYGNPIGRPQEVMNVVKYSLKSGNQLSMEALALKDYSQLPHVNADGEPVSYCFFRDAKDGKMMIWGTPKQFGEYLKFTYVEPIALLEDARAIPDIPDEYVGVVIDGLAAELAHEYALPADKVQLLIAKAQESKQTALAHDNENVSYFFEPNRRGL